MKFSRFVVTTLLSGVLFVPAAGFAQGTLADYQRSATLNQRFQGIPTGVAEQPTWIGDSNHLWYRKSVQGGSQFVYVDPATSTKRPAFDHQRLATALSAAAGASYTALTLPFNSFAYVNGEQGIEADAGASRYTCTLSDYTCTRIGEAQGRGGRGGFGRGGRGGGGRGGRGARGAGAGAGGRGGRGAAVDGATPVSVAPDGRQEVYVRDFNLWIRPAASDAPGEPLTNDGFEGGRYAFNSISWSPDSRRVAAYRVRPGFEHRIYFVRSSPQDQLQPRLEDQNYRKPGDVLDENQPTILDVAAKTQTRIDDALFPNAYSMSRLAWREDSRRITFEYNQRGHQVYRVIEIDAETGSTRALVNEEPETFFYYRDASGGLSDSGKRFRHDVDDGREIIWMSERDGWSHLYLYDGITGQVKNQITRGEWLVRAVDSVDVANRQIWFRGAGRNPGEDPYFTHYYRVNFDGTGLIALTEGDGSHTITWSPDRQYYIDTWSRVDQAPVSVVRRLSDQAVATDLERGDLTALQKAGWSAPEVFVAKGRDGVTDIWGIIVRPTNFNPSRRYPIIESIYAGPQGSFTPKTFSVNSGLRTIAELGFVVVQMDGMGTNNRSKAFHDVAWKNLGDAGFPDRILWHQAAAAKYRWYDHTRVGIYGTSAGGQNAAGAVFFHPEFYDVAVSSAGCHDNRMDKIWWNELWMSWPIGSHYDAASNVVAAPNLKGNLMLVVGEMDNNVDPASTMQVVNALIESDKFFDLLVIPNAGHTNGGAYGSRKRDDFFVKHLLGVEPPAWNQRGYALNAQEQEDDFLHPPDDFFMNPYIGPDRPLSWLDR